MSSRYVYQPGPNPSPSSVGVSVVSQTKSPGAHMTGLPLNHSDTPTTIGFVSGVQVLNGAGPNTSMRYLKGVAPPPKLFGGFPMRPVMRTSPPNGLSTHGERADLAVAGGKAIHRVDVGHQNVAHRLDKRDVSFELPGMELNAALFAVAPDRHVVRISWRRSRGPRQDAAQPDDPRTGLARHAELREIGLQEDGILHVLVGYRLKVEYVDGRGALVLEAGAVIEINPERDVFESSRCRTARRYSRSTS